MEDDEMTYHEFRELFYEKVSKSGSTKKAYIEAEEVHKERFNKSKYSSLESFRTVLSRHAKHKR